MRYSMRQSTSTRERAHDAGADAVGGRDRDAVVGGGEQGGSAAELRCQALGRAKPGASHRAP